MKDLKSRTVRAASWTFGSQVVLQAISFVMGIVLARLLMPDDFGLIAMVMVFTGFIGLISDIGLGSALIQKKDAREIHFCSVFWLNILLGSILAISLFLASHLISEFYDRDEIELICKILAINFVLGSLTLVPRTRLAKELMFKHITLTELIAIVLSGVTAISLAASGYGYWSLVIQLTTKQILMVIIIWILSNWRPKLIFSISAIKDLLGFSLSVFATNTLQYVAKNIDKLLLGKSFGSHPLGIYDKAQSMMLFPLQNVSRMIGTVMFPSLSLIQSDIDRVRNIYLRSIKTIALITFPMMTGMFAIAESFVLGVLGPQWSEVIPILHILCIAGIAGSIATVSGSVFKSQGAALLQLRVNLITQPIKILFIMAGINWGITGVAYGFTIATVINTYITLTISGRLINLRLVTLLYSFTPILFASCAMSMLLLIITTLIASYSELLQFCILLPAGIFIYLVIIIVTKLDAYLDLKNVLHKEFSQ